MEPVLGSWSVEMSSEVFGTKLGVVWEMAVKVCLHTSLFHSSLISIVFDDQKSGMGSVNTSFFTALNVWVCYHRVKLVEMYSIFYFTAKWFQY